MPFWFPFQLTSYDSLRIKCGETRLRKLLDLRERESCGSLCSPLDVRPFVIRELVVRQAFTDLGISDKARGSRNPI